MQSPHLIQSILLGFLEISISSLHSFLHIPQFRHFSVFISNLKKETLLNRPYMAPKGHIYLQKGLYKKKERITIVSKIVNLNLYKNPIAVLKVLLSIIRGILASNVPTGQIYLQNQGSPFPKKSEINIGKIITNTNKKRNLKYFNIFSPGRILIFFIKGIL